MSSKTIATAVLLLFVGASVAYLAVTEIRQRTTAAPATQSAVPLEGAATEAGSGQETEAPQRATTAPVSQSAVPQEGAATEAGSGQEPDASETPSTVIAYYFHGTRRCKTCLTIEAYADESMKTGFPQELETGRLTWRVLNVEEPENEHFVQDFELATRSVVLVEAKNGKTEKWKSLDKVWKLVGNKGAFVAYIQKETADYLGLVK